MSEVEMKEKKDRVDDALAATKAAIQEGIVIGGGCTFAKISKALEETVEIARETGSEEGCGYKLILSSICAPVLKICDNCGVSGEVILKDVQDMGNEEGYNALTNTYENLLESGVIDPSKVLRVALQNAASVSGTLLTTSYIVINDETKQEKQQAPMM